MDGSSPHRRCAASGPPASPPPCSGPASRSPRPRRAPGTFSSVNPGSSRTGRCPPSSRGAPGRLPRTNSCEVQRGAAGCSGGRRGYGNDSGGRQKSLKVRQDSHPWVRCVRVRVNLVSLVPEGGTRAQVIAAHAPLVAFAHRPATPSLLAARLGAAPRRLRLVRLRRDAGALGRVDTLGLRDACGTRHCRVPYDVMGGCERTHKHARVLCAPRRGIVAGGGATLGPSRWGCGPQDSTAPGSLREAAAATGVSWLDSRNRDRAGYGRAAPARLTPKGSRRTCK